MRREERRSEALIFPGLDGLLVTIDIKLGSKATNPEQKEEMSKEFLNPSLGVDLIFFSKQITTLF